jgi:hypothetical protein
MKFIKVYWFQVVIGLSLALNVTHFIAKYKFTVQSEVCYAGLATEYHDCMENVNETYSQGWLK